MVLIAHEKQQVPECHMQMSSFRISSMSELLCLFAMRSSSRYITSLLLTFDSNIKKLLNGRQRIYRGSRFMLFAYSDLDGHTFVLSSYSVYTLCPPGQNNPSSQTPEEKQLN